MDEFLEAALAEARAGGDEGGIPIGAVLVVDGEIVGRGRNRRVQDGSAIHHGETNALENAGRLAAEVYRRATMYTTLSPCDMCSGAILLYGIPRVVIGENRTFHDPNEVLGGRGVEVIDLDCEEAYDLLQRFITERPQDWFEDIGEDNP